MKIVCYGEVEERDKKDALEFYKRCIQGSEGHERQRYVEIVADLTTDEYIAWDKVEVPKGYHECQYCGRLAKGNDKDRLCELCQEVFGHSSYDEL